MRSRRRVWGMAFLCMTVVFVSGIVVSVVQSHGSMQNPVSRVYGCFLEGPESPTSAACQEAVAVGGTQALYDWNEINLANVAGRHQEFIPDGQLCSAGRDKYQGFDLARADWPAVRLPQSGPFTFTYRATAPHRGSFDLYVTRDGYDPTQPLRWSDLETAPFLTSIDPPLVDGSYVMESQLPEGKSGRHLIYAIWQRSDSPEAFYSCSDVIFGDESNPTTVPPTAAPTGTPAPPTEVPTGTPVAPTSTPVVTPTPPADTSAWQFDVAYVVGDEVTYEGSTYRCIQPHTSLPNWQPPNVPALWQLID
ncbi:MAG: lytic polysaccharide monooxygenase [Chloroflexota bacterium]